MTFIVARSGRGPTDEQFATLKAKVEMIANSAKELTSDKIQAAVEQALRPLAAEIALMEKEMGMRNGMLLNPRQPMHVRLVWVWGHSRCLYPGHRVHRQYRSFRSHDAISSDLCHRSRSGHSVHF